MKRLLLLMAILLVAAFASASSGGLVVLAVKSKDLPPYDQVITGFSSELGDDALRLVVIDDVEKTGDIGARVVGIKPDLMLCLGTEALECGLSIGSIPKFFCMVTASRAESLKERPGICGVTIDLPSSTQFEILLEAFPRLKRLGVLYNPEFNGELITEAQSSGAGMGIEVLAQPVRSIKDVPSALLDLDGRIDALWSIFDATAYGPETIRYILLHTLRKNVPFIGFSPQHAKAGAVIAIQGDYEDMGRQIGVAVRATTRGERLPVNVMHPRKARILVNRKVARAMGISFPRDFLERVSQFY